MSGEPAVRTVRFDEVLAHPRVVQVLRRAVQHGRVAHAYLLYGPQGTGKGALARALAAAVLCAAPQAGSACGQCAHCQACRSGRHPDLRELEPATQAGHLSLAQVLGLREWLQLSPAAGRAKVAVVHGADRLTPEAANALLKVLEEPPAGTVVVLLAQDRGAVLPTVRSRCAAVHVPSMGLQALAQALERRGAAPEQARELARLARGRPGAALEGAPMQRQSLQTAAEWVRRALQDPPGEVDRLAQRLESAELAEVEDGLCAMMWLWRDLAVAQLDGGLQAPWAHGGPQGGPVRLPALQPAAVAEGLRRMVQARRWLADYTNRRLVMDWLWMSLRLLVRQAAAQRAG